MCFETTAAHSTIYPKRSSLSAFSLSEEQAQALLSYCHLHYIYTTFHYIHYISQRSNAKTALELPDYSVKIRSKVQTLTRAILPRNQSPSVSNSQRGQSCEQIFDSSTTFLNPLVGTNSLYGKQTVGFFPLASHARRACEARALRARKPLTPRFTEFFTDFEKKSRLIWSLLERAFFSLSLG